MLRFVAVLLVVASLAGCAEEGGTRAPAAPAPSGDVWQRGLDAGAKWQGDAVLVSATAWEYANATQVQRLEDSPDKGKQARAVVDGTPGDGNAAVWRFGFASDSAQAFRDFFVDKQGLLHEEAATMSGSFAGAAKVPLETPTLQTTALATQAKENEAWSTALAAGDSIVWVYFGTACGPHALAAAYRDVDGQPEIGLFYHAATGEFLGAGDVVPCLPPKAEVATLQYQVNAATPDSGTFTLEEAHDNMTLRLASAGFGLPMQTIMATVTTPDGRTVDMTVTTGFMQQPDVQVLDMVVPGEYAVEFTMGTGAQASGSLQVCTSGSPPDQPNQACGEADGATR